ncbi:MAG: hypothetical protein NTY88_01945 [Bacteroidetes bacterium]|nr:hypothetical protein [Bacteroidota bacterium]
MKNKFLLLLLLVAGTQFSFGQTSYHVYDSIYQSDYDYPSTSWKLTSRAYAYIANGCLHEDSFHTEAYDDLSSTWSPFSKDLYQYNGNNKLRMPKR